MGTTLTTDLTADALLARFEQEYQTYHRISDKRAREQRKLLREFSDRLAPRTLADADYDDFQAFAGYLTGDFHVNTVRKKLNMVRPFFSWAYAARLISADQYLHLKEVKDPRGATGISKPNPYAPEEIREFWAQLEMRLPLLPSRGRGSQGMNRWIRGKSPFRVVARHGMRLQIEAIAHLALDGGLRREEIYRLSLDDAHYDNAYVLVQGAQKGENFGSDTRRLVPFTAASRKAVHDWIEFRTLMRPEHDRMWVLCRGPHTYSKPMPFERFESLLLRQVGPGWQLQRFRHTCATEWLRAGLPLEYVSELLGHNTLEQTRAYAKIVGSDIERELGRVEENFSRRLRRAA